MKNLNILDISFYQIQIFLILAEELNFSTTASLLNMAQPTLSKKISVLEDAIGIKLFNRDKRPLELTESGSFFYNEWKGMTKKFERSIELARGHGYNTGSRLVVCMLDTGKRLMAMEAAVKTLENTHQGLNLLEVYSTSDDWKRKLISREIDLMITLALEEPFIDNKEFKSVEIMTCPKLLCMLKSNPLSKKESISYEDLRDQNFIVNSIQTFPAHYDFIRRVCKLHGFEPSVSRYVESVHSLVWYLRKDNEVVICDRFLRDIENPNIKQFELPNTQSGLLAVWRRGDNNSLIDEYIDTIKQAFRDAPSLIDQICLCQDC